MEIEKISQSTLDAWNKHMLEHQKARKKFYADTNNGKFKEIKVDEALISHTSNPEFEKMNRKDMELMEALRDHTIKVDVPFLKKWQEDMENQQCNGVARLCGCCGANWDMNQYSLECRGCDAAYEPKPGIPETELPTKGGYQPWLACAPEVASIFESGRAGFAPSPTEMFSSTPTPDDFIDLSQGGQHNNRYKEYDRLNEELYKFVNGNLRSHDGFTCAICNANWDEGEWSPECPSCQDCNYVRNPHPPADTFLQELAAMGGCTSGHNPPINNVISSGPIVVGATTGFEMLDKYAKVEPKGCTCDIMVLMAQGCKCGWLATERAKAKDEQYPPELEI